MADKTSYLLRQLNVFFAKKIDPHSHISCMNEWDDDWEYYNQFSSQLSQESSHLIPYQNSNGYIIVSKNPDNLHLEVKTHDLHEDMLQKTMYDYDDLPCYLVIHVSIWCFEEWNIGHSCLFIFCPRTKVQWFFDPNGSMYSAVWQALETRPLIKGFEPKCICPCCGFQTKLEQIIGAKHDSICGIICSLINLQLSLTHVDIEMVMQFWKIMVDIPLYWEQSRWCINNFVYVYQNVFVNGEDADRIL